MALRKARGAHADGLLPGYSGLAEIGGGAFATVYRAVEAETGRAVALKILKVDTIHAHLIETFHHEIRALAKVSDHPNIVTLYRPATTTDGRPVLVLELCQGSLASRVRTGGPLDPQEATRVAVKIAGALETAHRNGFLHRDMKPQNILVTKPGEPALADFGVAALQASAQATAGVFGFTTLHAAPEMLEGHHLSPATDIYGLASTMYQLLTGQAPFATFENEAPASVILRILRDPVRPLRSEGIPLALSDLIEAALSKEPEGRPRTALEFAHALQAVEASVGWPVTDFLAWGEEGAPTGAGPSRPAGVPPVGQGRREGAGSWPGAPAPPTPAGSPPPDALYPSAPATRVERLDAPAARPTLPPLLPTAPEPTASEPAAGLARSGAAASPRAAGPPVPAPPVPPSPPPPSPAPSSGAAASSGPAPTPPPSARRAPSLARPEPGVRNVVVPEQGSRGQPSAALVPPEQPLAPLTPRSPEVPLPGPSSSRPAQPSHRFTDPAVPAGVAGAESVHVESVYERTMDVASLFGRRLDTGASAGAPEATAGRPGRVPAYAVAGLALAVAVVVAAILLVTGVI